MRGSKPIPVLDSMVACLDSQSKEGVGCLAKRQSARPTSVLQATRPPPGSPRPQTKEASVVINPDVDRWLCPKCGRVMHLTSSGLACDNMDSKIQPLPRVENLPWAYLRHYLSIKRANPNLFYLEGVTGLWVYAVGLHVRCLERCPPQDVRLARVKTERGNGARAFRLSKISQKGIRGG